MKAGFLAVALWCVPLVHAHGFLECIPPKKIEVLAGMPSYQFDLPIKNISPEKTNIDSVVGDCSCLNFEYSRTAIAPGNTATIRVLVALKQKPTRMDHTVTVSAGNEAPLNIGFEIEIIGGVIAKPTFLSWSGAELGMKSVSFVSRRRTAIKDAQLTNAPSGYEIAILNANGGPEVSVTRLRGTVPKLSDLSFVVRSEDGSVDEVSIPLLAR